jgi:hypothetical protein
VKINLNLAVLFHFSDQSFDTDSSVKYAGNRTVLPCNKWSSPSPAYDNSGEISHNPSPSSLPPLRSTNLQQRVIKKRFHSFLVSDLLFKLEIPSLHVVGLESGVPSLFFNGKNSSSRTTSIATSLQKRKKKQSKEKPNPNLHLFDKGNTSKTNISNLKPFSFGGRIILPA